MGARWNENADKKADARGKASVRGEFLYSES